MSSDERWGAGDKEKWYNIGTAKIGNQCYPLFFGEHPHSRQDNKEYVDTGHGEPVGFDGFRCLIDVHITSSNYMKKPYYSGDEVRKSVSDGEVVFEFFCRDPKYALLRAYQLITELSEHPSFWLNKSDRDKLVGRKVYYRDAPAIIKRLVVDQGCVILATEDGSPFPDPPWRDAGYEREVTIKDKVLSPHIWWFRD